MFIIDSHTLGNGTRVQLCRVVADNGASSFVIRTVPLSGEGTYASFGARRYAEAAFERVTQRVRVTA